MNRLSAFIPFDYGIVD